MLVSVLVLGLDLVLVLGLNLVLVLMFDSGLVDGVHRQAYLTACLDSWGSFSV